MAADLKQEKVRRVGRPRGGPGGTRATLSPLHPQKLRGLPHPPPKVQLANPAAAQPCLRIKHPSPRLSQAEPPTTPLGCQQSCPFGLRGQERRPGELDLRLPVRPAWLRPFMFGPTSAVFIGGVPGGQLRVLWAFRGWSLCPALALWRPLQLGSSFHLVRDSASDQFFSPSDIFTVFTLQNYI